MTLLRTSARRIVNLERPDSLAEQLLEPMLFHTGRRPSEAEQKSWSRSLPVLAQDLVDAGLGEVEMLLEYHLRSPPSVPTSCLLARILRPAQLACSH